MSNPEQLKKEIEAIEEAITNPTEVAGNQGEVIIEDVVEPTLVAPEQTPEIVPVDTDNLDKKEKKVYTNWKKRFTNLKTSQDGTIFDLRQDNIRKSEDIQALSGKVTKLEEMIAKMTSATKSNALDGVITPEEAEILGPEAVSSMSRIVEVATENAVKPLVEQIEETRVFQKVSEDAQLERQRVDNQTLFLTRLGDVVDDYQEINSDPSFLAYMKELDTFSGYTRERLFKVAEHSGDVGRVAGFFNDFKAARAQVNPILEDAVTPITNAQGSTEATQTNDNTISWMEISDFYDRANRGEFAGRESERIALNAKYDLAFQEKRVVQ